jgi:glycosyltransferase involved in cell wall biosynthesis
MNVLFVNQHSFSYLGGVELHILNLAQELTKNGVKVSLLCRDDSERSGWKPEAENVEIIRVSGIRQMFRVMKMRRKQIDVCHAHMSRKPFSFCGVLCAYLLDIPVVFTPHCFYPSANLANRVKKLLYDHTATRMTLRLADKVISLTECDQRDAMRFGMSLAKSRLIPNSVHFSRLSDSAPPAFKKKYAIEEDYLLYVGRFSAEKCVDFLIRNHVSFPGIGLVLIGQDDGELGRLRRLVETLGLSRWVHTIERPPFKDVCAAYREAIALVLASRYEGLPTVVLEARALGTPTIAPCVGGIPFVNGLKEEGSLYSWGDDQGYVARARNLIARRRRVGEVDRSKVVESYDWQANALKILDLYTNVCARK